MASVEDSGPLTPTMRAALAKEGRLIFGQFWWFAPVCALGSGIGGHILSGGTIAFTIVFTLLFFLFLMTLIGLIVLGVRWQARRDLRAGIYFCHRRGFRIITPQNIYYLHFAQTDLILRPQPNAATIQALRDSTPGMLIYTASRMVLAV